MRRILLTLAEDTTETDCGACPHAMGVRCYAFRAYVGGDRMRLPECLAAEAAAARMVEIAPEDAAGYLVAISRTVGSDPEPYERTTRAIRAHAAGSGAAEASEGACQACTIYGPRPTCPACKGTGSTTGTKS